MVEINEMVELIKKTEDKEIRSILLDGLQYQLTSRAPTSPTYTPPWGTTTSVPCGQNNTGGVWM